MTDYTQQRWSAVTASCRALCALLLSIAVVVGAGSVSQAAPLVSPAGNAPSDTSLGSDNQHSGQAQFQALQRKAKPSLDQVLRELPANKPSYVTTTKIVNNKPVVQKTKVANRASASAYVAKQLADPATRDVSKTVKYQVNSDDTYRSYQWGLDRLKGEQTWAAQPGNGVTVAVIDTGVVLHSDLRAVMVAGTDFVTPGGNGTADVRGHGTEVAGVLAAVANNSMGIAGMAQGIRIMPIKALADDGTGYDSDIANAMVWATDHGARVINLSLGGAGYSSALDYGVSYATSRDVVVVAAAGNERQSIDGDQTIYPAALPNVLAVGATDKVDQPAPFSSSGVSDSSPDYVDVAAPGMDIAVTLNNGGYGAADGTSFASPFAAALAALVRAADTTRNESAVRQAITNTALDIYTAGADPYTGRGLIQPLAALAGGGTPADTQIKAVSIPYRVLYGTSATVKFQMTTTTGSPVPGEIVNICTQTAPATTYSCTRALTDSNGYATKSSWAGGNMLSYVYFSGSSTANSSYSSKYATYVMPKISIAGGYHQLAVSVGPWASGMQISLYRYVNGSLYHVITRTLPSTGRWSVIGLTRGYYVARVSPSSRFTAVSSGKVWVS